MAETVSWFYWRERENSEPSHVTPCESGSSTNSEGAWDSRAETVKERDLLYVRVCCERLDVWRTHMLMLWSLQTRLTVGWPFLLPVPSSSCLCSLLHPWHSKMQLGQGVCVRACIFVCVYHCWGSYKTVPIWKSSATGYYRKWKRDLRQQYILNII